MKGSSFTKKGISLFLILTMMVMLLSINVFAVDTQRDDKLVAEFFVVEYENIMFSPNAIDLGSDDTDAILSDAEEPDPFAPSTRSLSLLFSYTGSGVTTTLTTSASGKTFTKSSLTYGYLRVCGRGEYTYAPYGVTFRAGACYYDGYSGSFITNPLQYVEFYNDSYNFDDLPASNFASGTTYYGFMTNTFTPYEQLSGTFYLYNISI